MKHTLSLLLLVLSVTAASAQKSTVKVKKGKIVKNDVPIAAIDTKGGIFKSYDVNISSLDNKPLIHVKQELYNLKSLLYPSAIYYHITFNNTASTQVDYCLSADRPKLVEAGIVDILFHDSTGIKLLENDSTLSEEGIQHFAKKYHRDLKADSANKIEYLKAISNALEGNAARRMDQQIVLKMTSKREGFYNAASRMVNEYVHDVIQDGTVLGTVTTTITATATGASQSRLVFKKAIVKPLEWNGTKLFFVEAAILESDGMFGELRTLYDNKRHDMPKGDGNRGEYVLANFLVNKGYL